LVFPSATACATEPELNDDYAIYEVDSDPIPLTPVPGADITAWTGAIDGLDVGEWSSSADLVTNPHRVTEAAPMEDPRVDDERFSWVLEGSPSAETADLIFIAGAVTDANNGLLNISCTVDYEVYAGDAPGGPVLFPFVEIRELMRGCVSGSGNNAIAADELSAWLNEQMDVAEEAYETEEGHAYFHVSNMIDADDVLVWFSSGSTTTFVSLYVDPRASAGSA
jgi:hypothetical protein